MHRRALLGSLAPGVVSAAGCLSAPRPGGQLGVPAGETPWGEDWRTDGVDRVVVDRGPAERTGIGASRTALTLPTAIVTFSLTNRSDEQLAVNPAGWTLWRRDGEGWVGVYPDGYLQPLRSLGPSDSLTWKVRIDNHGAGLGGLTVDTEGEFPTFASVEPGRYAVSNAVEFPERTVLAVSVVDIVRG